MYEDHEPRGLNQQNRLEKQGDLPDKYKTSAYNFDYGIDIPTRTIFLVGEISDISVLDIILHAKMIFNVTDDYDSDINLYIDSYGGDLYSALGIIDYFDSLSCKVNTITRGRAMSAGALLLLSGTGKRYASKYASIMLHEVSADLAGKSGDLKSSAKQIGMLQEVTNKIISEKTNKNDIKWWEHTLSKDFYMSAEEALEIGIIDHII